MHLRFWEEAVYIQVVATGYDTLRQLVGDLPTAEPHLDRILGTMRERSDLGDEILRGRRLLFLLRIEVENDFSLFCSYFVDNYSLVRYYFYIFAPDGFY